MQFPFLKPQQSKTTNSTSPNPFFSFFSNPPWKPHLQSFFQSLHPTPTPPPFAQLSLPISSVGSHRFDVAMSAADMEERLAGVPVYTLSNNSDEFVLVSGVSTGKAMGLFCFKEEDADAMLGRMKAMNQGLSEGSRVVAVALNKVVQLKVDGVAFRLIPDSSQIANAIKMQDEEKLGDALQEFPGVPVFQSKSLVLKDQNKRYRPFFFRKEDLDNSLLRASRQQAQLNPAFRKGDIQVCILEEIIKSMKGNTASDWDDVVFIPPGFNVSTDISKANSVANA